MGSIRKRFAERRLALRLTQDQVATRARTTRKTVADFESGAAGPRLPTLARLLSAVGLELAVRETGALPAFEDLQDRYPDDLGAPETPKRRARPRRTG